MNIPENIPAKIAHADVSASEQLLMILMDLVDAVELVDEALIAWPWHRENVRAKLEAANKVLGRPS